MKAVTDIVDTEIESEYFSSSDSMTSFVPDTNNELFQTGIRLVNHSARNIFLTGRAGTGKTTFLKFIRQNCPKQMAVVAPTGVAAINAGGVTIHSFFQLPLSPYIPGSPELPGTRENTVDRTYLISQLRMTKEKKDLLRELELLIIDEISMVRADTLDALDAVLRHVRRKPGRPFGGVQVLMIGDMYQLPPVRDEDKWKWLAPFYENPYFFSSRVMQEDTPVYLEFTKIYRQKDENFIRLLNQVRNNALNEEGIALLQSRYQPQVSRHHDDEAVILTTHNETARRINTSELAKLNPPSRFYRASLTGDFNKNVFPADELLELRVGARVMFLRNDLDRRKRYYNGKTGIVSELWEDKILVQCKNEPEPIELKRETWETIRYKLNPHTRKMEEEVLGTYVQFPLRLAWAITIHKSQGLTFEKAIIDAGKAFTPGQVYVALSRCTSLEGLTLQTPIRPDSLATDPAIDEFTSRAFENQDLGDELEKARRGFELLQLTSIFDFSEILKSAEILKSYFLENLAAFSGEKEQFLAILAEKSQSLQKPGLQFVQWLTPQMDRLEEPGVKEAVLAKIRSGSAHFSGIIGHFIDFLLNPGVKAVNKAKAHPVQESLKEIFADLTFRLHMISGEPVFLNNPAWYNRKSEFRVRPYTFNIYGGSKRDEEVPVHADLYKTLRLLRDHLSGEFLKPIYMIAGFKTLKDMADFLPRTEEEIIRIRGFGPGKMKLYGQQFLEVINDYCEEHGLDSMMPESDPPKEKKTTKKPAAESSAAETLRLFRSGMSIGEIARSRNLAISTIEGHFIPFLHHKEMSAAELLGEKKFKLIDDYLSKSDETTLTAIRTGLGERFSFNEIRWVLAARKPVDTTGIDND